MENLHKFSTGEILLELNLFVKVVLCKRRAFYTRSNIMNKALGEVIPKKKENR
jgi:hypothetical protein